MGILAGHVGGRRSAIAHRHPEALGRADGDVGAHRAGLLEDCQRQGIGDDDADRARRMQSCDMRSEVGDRAIGSGILEDRAEHP